jgi:CelD/BcsL family acetyltransferase involved in cellulose biosynthesis
MISPVNVLSLHEISDSPIERLAVEYNGFLIDTAAPADLPAHILKHLAVWSSRECFADDWDELHLSGVQGSWLAAMRASGLTIAVDRSEPVIGIQLDTACQRDQFVARLGRSTRAQVRRTLNALSKRGSIEMTCAGSVATAHDYLARLAELNIERWHEAAMRSPYETPEFVDFHRTLIARAWPRGEVEVVALAVGGKPIGYMYNFLWRRTVHHYSAGISFDPDRRIKTGLAFHILLAERYGQRGFSLYDFMAGEARYKRSLGTQHDTLYWVRGQRDRAKLRIEAGAMAIKRMVTGFYAKLRPSNSDE